jgi:hypothetical protein
MKTQLTTISVVVLALCACGPGAKITGGKQGAAEALYAASGPTKGGANKLGSGIDITGDVNVPCSEGGNAVLKGFGLTTGAGGLLASVGLSFTTEYKGCGVKTDLGTAVLNGSVAVSQSTKVTGTSVDVDQSIKGKVLFQGSCDDFLDIDISEKVAASALTQTSGGVSMVLKGTIADSAGSFSYDESVSVTPGKISVEITKK